MLGVAALLLVITYTCFRVANYGPDYPTVDRLRSATETNPYPVQFDPAAPSVDSLLSRLRGRTNPKEEPQK